VDVVPTILDYLSIDEEGLGLEGRSLRPLIEGREEPIRYAFAKQTAYRSSDDGRFHLILDSDNDAFTLFDIGNDPLEQQDLYDPAHPEFAPLRNALFGWLDETSQRGRLDESTAADRAKEEELRALGYLE
jgi:arylsulfatase A-like enzyme